MGVTIVRLPCAQGTFVLENLAAVRGVVSTAWCRQMSQTAAAQQTGTDVPYDWAHAARTCDQP